MMVFIKTYFVFLVLVILLLAPSSLSGQDGTDAAAFLELGIGARAMSMGGAYVSIANDGTSFYWNPAGSSLLQRAEVGGMYASLFKSLEKQFYIGFTRPLYGAGAISINWVRLSVPEIPFYVSPNLDKTYEERIFESTLGGNWEQNVLTQDALEFDNFNNDAFIINLAKLLRFNMDFGWQYFVLPVEVPIGFNVKLIRQSLFNRKSSGIGFDFGTMLRFGVDDLLDNRKLGKFSIGFAWKDIFDTKITWDTDSRHADRVKDNWHLGLSYMQPISGLNSQVLFAYALKKKFYTTHHLGSEYIYSNRLAIRFGLDDGEFTAGVGLRISLLRVDYAFINHELGGNHRITAFIQL
jgi:hypothetical protein